MKESKFSRGAWWVLLFALLLLLVNIGQLAYRFTLPTDGWLVIATDVDNANWQYKTNLVGAPSDLASDDELLTVEGVDVRGTATNEMRVPPPQWRAGETVTMQVKRGSQIVDVQVPVVNWTLQAFWRAQVTNVVQLVALLSDFVLLLVAGLTFFRRPDILAARALLVFAVAITCPAISGTLPDGISVEFNPVAFGFTAIYSYAIYAILVGPSLLGFSLLFPKPKQILQGYRWLIWVPVGLGLFVFILFLLVLTGIAYVPAAVLWFFALGTLVVSVISIAHSGWTVHDHIGRAQMRWAGSGFAIGILLFALNFPASFHWVPSWMELWLLAIANLATPIIGLGVAIAILRYRLFDIDVIIRRTLTYALVTAMLVLVFFVSIIVLQQIFARVTGSGENEIVTVLSTLAIAALFVPLRNRVQSGIDKQFNRKKYDAQQILGDFARTARDETDLETLTARLMQVVDETMQPKSVSVWLAGDKRKRTP